LDVHDHLIHYIGYVIDMLIIPWVKLDPTLEPYILHSFIYNVYTYIGMSFYCQYVASLFHYETSSRFKEFRKFKSFNHPNDIKFLLYFQSCLNIYFVLKTILCCFKLSISIISSFVCITVTPSQNSVQRAIYNASVTSVSKNSRIV
jgi:hypothetical protein